MIFRSVFIIWTGLAPISVIQRFRHFHLQAINLVSIIHAYKWLYFIFISFLHGLYLLPDATKNNLDDFLASVDELEQLTGEKIPVADDVKNDKPSQSWMTPGGYKKSWLYKALWNENYAVVGFLGECSLRLRLGHRGLLQLRKTSLFVHSGTILF